MKHSCVKSNNKKSAGFKTHCCIDWIFYTYSGTHFLPPAPHPVFWHFLTPVRINIPSHVRICAIYTYPPYLPARSITTEHVTYNNWFFLPWRNSPPPQQWAKASSLSKLHDHTQSHYIRQDSFGRVIRPTQRPLRASTQHSQQKDTHAPGGIRTCNLKKRAAADLSFRPREHWDGLEWWIQLFKRKLCEVTNWKSILLRFHGN